MSNDLVSRQLAAMPSSRTTAGESTSATGKRTLVEQAGAPAIQKRGGGDQPEGATHAAAARGAATPASSLPFKDSLQRAFGRHDVSSIQAHTGPEAAQTTAAMGADAYASGDHVVLGKSDLHTVAHEAAHVVQQRSGVQLKGGVGQAGDAYEQHADKVADKVVAGESAESLLSEMAGEQGAHQSGQSSKTGQSGQNDKSGQSGKSSEAGEHEAGEHEAGEHEAGEHEGNEDQHHDAALDGEHAPQAGPVEAAPDGNAAQPGAVQMKASGSTGAVQLKQRSRKGGYRQAPSLASARGGSKLIRRGMKGASVKFVQQHVHADPDGLFGPHTEAAVKRFQRAHHIEVDGIVGRHTMAAIDHGGAAQKGGSAAHDDGGAAPTGSEAQVREQVIDRAKRHMGAPYSWAAEGPGMFDCSGFAWYVLHTDMHLTGAGRVNAAGLSHAPYTTPTGSPQKGDLVFYSSGGISHVTIALGHGSQVIGASGGGQNTHGHDPNARVKITDWSHDSRHKSFGSIRSLINRRAHK